MPQLSIPQLLDQIETATAKVAELSRTWSATRAKHYPANLATALRSVNAAPARVDEVHQALSADLRRLDEALSEAWSAASRAGDIVEAAKELADDKGAYGLTFPTYGH